MAKIFLKEEKGVALLLTIGVLALMSIIATSFAINMQLDLKIASNFRDSLKAQYLAEAGINRAIVELAYGAQGAVNNAIDASNETWYANNPYSDNTLLNGNGSYVVTKIRDCGSQIYINDANPNLSAILENLVAAIGSPLSSGDGNAIVANRPPLKIVDGCPVGGGYATKEQIKMAPGITEAKYNAIKDYITIYAFVDQDVIDPQDTTTPYAFSPRALVNVNAAAKAVLKAVLTGVSDGSNSISSLEAEDLAEHLINGRPYATFDELWIRLLTAETMGLIEDGDAAVVMANANPNTDLMRANPNYTWRYKHVSKGTDDTPVYDAYGVPFAIDKTRLQTSTTEFCFNSGGYYEIESTGMIKDQSGNQIAERKSRAVVKIFDIWRQTTQSQFVQGIGSNVQTYPEFDHESSTILPATYDGQIMLAALGVTGPPASGETFRRIINEDKDDIDNDFDADYAAGNGEFQSGFMANNPNEASSVNSSNPGNLFPDGVFYKVDDVDVYDSFWPQSNVNADDGSVEFWFKPDWHYAYTNFPNAFNAGKLFEAQTSWQSADWRWANSSMDIYVAAASDEIHWRIHDKYWNEKFIKYGLVNATTYPWKPGAWHHIVITWDFQDWEEPPPGDPVYDQYLYVDGAEVNHLQYASPPKPFVSVRGLAFGADWNGIEAPNGTIDGIRIFNSAISGGTVGTDFAAGRYYSASDGYFESSENSIGSTRLCTISWTEHTMDKDGFEIVPGADIQFDIYDGSNWIGDYENRSNPAGMSLGTLTSGAGNIKYKAYFKNSAATLLDTPVLDDVTITYIKAIEILYWRQET